MPTEFLKEFIGLVCEIDLVNDVDRVAELVAVEGDWLKVDEYGKTKLINGALVVSITPMPEKEQERYRRKQNR